MDKIASWIKSAVNGFKAEEGKTKKDLVASVEAVETKIKEAIDRVNSDILTSYDEGIKLAMDSDLVEVVSKLTDAKKQIIAFINETNQIRAGLFNFKKSSLFSTATEKIISAVANKTIDVRDLARKDFVTIKTIVGFDKSDEILKSALQRYNAQHKVIAVENSVDRLSALKEETFSVADPAAIGDKVQSITLAIMGEEVKVNDRQTTDYVVVLYWTDSQASALKKAFSTQEEAEKFYNDYKLKLDTIAKAVADSKIEDALKLMQDLLNVSETVTEPNAEEQPQIIVGK